MLGGGTWDTARRITIPLALPALLAGMLIAFLQAMTLFGSPAILALPAGFHTMTTKIWSLFQYPPKPELAAAASLPLLVLTVMLLRAQHMILGRKGYSVVGGKTGDPRLIKLGWLERGRRSAFVLHRADAAGVPAVFRAVQRRVLADRDHAGDAVERHAAQHLVHVLRAVVDQDRAAEHLHARRADRDARHAAGAGDRLSHGAAGGAPAIARSASSPPRRSRSPASCSASACSWATRSRRSCSTARCGSCCSPTSPSSCRRPTSSCQSAFRAVASGAGGREPHPRRDAAAGAAPRSPRRCCAPA